MQDSTNPNLPETKRRSSIFSSWAEVAVAVRCNSSRQITTSITFQDEDHKDSSPACPSDTVDHEARRHSSFSTGPMTIQSTILFLDLEGFSKTSEINQKWIIRDFMCTLRDLLTFAYGYAPNRARIEEYVILPTGDGAAVCVMRPPDAHSSCTRCESISLEGNEETALWVGASLLIWARKRNVGLRVGLNSGDLTLVEDPYGDANVCGDAINLASRIMDTSLPGQILASSDTVVHKLKSSLEHSSIGCQRCPNLHYDIAPESCEIVVKHGVTTHVQSIMCTLTDMLDIKRSDNARSRSYMEDEVSQSSSYTNESILPGPRHTSSRSTLSTSLASSKESSPLSLYQSVGSHDTPKTKWYMKIKPTEMQADASSIRPKLLPKELIQRHKHIAFIGIAHDNLYDVFKEALKENPGLTWEQVYIFYPSDACLQALASSLIQTGEELILLKNTSKNALLENLYHVVDDLRILELEQLLHCGSYWDWRNQGGYIHISPLVWGANPKTCPAMNYYWNSATPGPEYSVYKSGLEYLLNVASQDDKSAKLM